MSIDVETLVYVMVSLRLDITLHCKVKNMLWLAFVKSTAILSYPYFFPLTSMQDLHVTSTEQTVLQYVVLFS